VAKVDRDWTKTGTVEGMAKWLQKESDALLVLVVRVEDAVLIADPRLTPSDAQMVVVDRIGGLVRGLDEARNAKRPGVRENLGPNRE